MLTEQIRQHKEDTTHMVSKAQEARHKLLTLRNYEQDKIRQSIQQTIDYATNPICHLLNVRSTNTFVNK